MSIVYQVWEDNRMPTDTKNVLEVLSKDDDGIFHNWNSFLTRKGLLKKYCYRLEQYKHLFGGGKYMAVASEDLGFTFEYDANMPTMVEIFVTAHIKEPE